MWHQLLVSPKADPQFAESAGELLQSIARDLIFITTALCCVLVLVAFLFAPGNLGLQTISLGLAAILVCVLSLRFLSRNLLLAEIIWQTGLGVVIFLAIDILQQPLLGFAFILFPLCAVITLGMPAGVAAGVVVSVFAWFLTQNWLAFPLPVGLGVGIAVGGAIAGLFGWAATRSLFTVTQWSMNSFEKAEKRLEEARLQRLELKQVQEDLILANRELARLSDRLKAMYQIAEEARQAKEEFVANVSHELRTPLNMIIGFTEVITRSPHVYGERLPPALLADITAIQRNSQHLSKLVNDVLDLSQVDAGRMALQREWIEPHLMILEALQTVQTLFKSKGLYLEMNVPPDLPHVFCDSTRIRQVLINLLSNSGRFTEKGGVRVNAWVNQDDLYISVADTGPGISPENQKKLFEPFQQLDGSIRRRYGGSGLGLVISKRLVEAHSGKIYLESQVGAGTTITIHFPVGTVSQGTPTGKGVQQWFNPYMNYADRIRTRPFKAPQPIITPRFIILEKGATVKRLLSTYLQGCETISTNNLEEAMQELLRSPAQALVVNTPPYHEETATLIAQLGTLPHQTPLLTCWVPEEQDVTRQLGVVRYLVKPVSLDDLLAAITSLGENVKTILLVDDQPEMLQLFARVLSAHERQYSVLQAKNGGRGLSLMRQHQPEVVLLDLVMPGMDGFQVLQEKQKDPGIRDIPVIIISSQDPNGQPIVSDMLMASRSGGISARDLAACVGAVSAILSPSAQPGGLKPPEMPGA